jgi:ssRNA-specific RNase YbeY (16S rRNA maturation enzyme)
MLHAMIIVDPEANSGTKARAGVVLSALRPFLRRARRVVPVAGQVSVLLISDSAIKRLNGKFRGLNHATDVLSFPALDVLPASVAVRTRPIPPSQAILPSRSIPQRVRPRSLATRC